MAASSAKPNAASKSSARRDNAGRPVIAITGMGLVTSLGVGKEDNWAKLTAGKSGIRRISRFPLDSLRTTIAGTVDDVYKDYMPPAELSERIALLACEEAIAQAAIGSKGHFPGPLFLALPPLEIEWPYRVRLAEQAAPDRDAGYPDLMRVAHEPQFAPIYETIKYGIIGENLAAHFGTEGSPISLTTACASGGTAIQLGVEA
ncbi:MAG TPA: beta-ketoacyl synthase N-terminal-like domain-containing protein, partial [Xanthobacteraceae bacterium]|nr:beta-ketoacyl synthase N-terminal-like domain-containing protein [Xanthobacteraceae bacterium]